MEKRVKILIGAGVLLLISAAVILAVRLWGLLPFWGERVETPPEEEPLIKIEAAAIRQRTFKYTIDVKYPRFSGAPETEGANSKLQVKIEPIVEQFKKNANEVEGGVPFEFGSELIIDYEIILLNPKLASIEFIASDYITGAAHPNNYYLTFNYDFEAEKELEFSDLFNEDSNYLKRISDYAITDLRARDINSDWLEDGAGPKIENYQKFTLSQDGLIIYFDPYQVAAYAYGGQEVEILYADISDILQAEIIESARLD
ncbi:MAG: DUF3298 and DUF4163 domain-containing protein [Candidatus Colwellbacteria bacterium]|nr:DUF3298 and DUF4163 domain-containing protein [Candidatus Colwellbacteria bacterium]